MKLLKVYTKRFVCIKVGEKTSEFYDSEGKHYKFFNQDMHKTREIKK